MKDYEKTGYLNCNFKLFHIKDKSSKSYDFHYHEFHKVIFFLEGDVSYQIEGQSYRLKPQDIVIVPAGTVHRPVIESGKTYERIILYVSTEFLEGASALSACFRTVREKKSHVLRLGSLSFQSKLWKNVLELENSFQDTDYANEFYRDALFRTFLVHLTRAVLNNTDELLHIETQNSKIASVMEYLSEHLEEDITIDWLASHFYISKFHLMHLFKEETGYTIYAYLNMKRLLKARALISSGTEAADACYLCGFRNYSTFFRAYKKYFAISPGQTR